MGTPSSSSPWPLLLGALPALVGKLEALRPPLLRVEVDGEGVLVAVWPGREALEAHRRFPGMPCITPQEWVAGVLHRLAERYPNPNAVELWGQWPGQPPRRERLARVVRRSKAA